MYGTHTPTTQPTASMAWIYRKRASKRDDKQNLVAYGCTPLTEEVASVEGDIEVCSLSNEPGCCEQDLDVAGPLPYPRTLWTLNPLTEDMVASWNAHTQVPANPTSTPINLPLATSTNGTTTTTNTRLPWERNSWDLHKSREVYLRMRAKWWLGVRTPVVGSSLPRLKVYPWRCDEPLVLDRKMVQR